MEHSENDTTEMNDEQSEEDFVHLLNLSHSFDEDSSTTEEYDVSVVPSYQDLLGHEGITEYLDHSFQSEQPCLFCGKNTDRKFANMTYFCEDCHFSNDITLSHQDLDSYVQMKSIEERKCAGCSLEYKNGSYHNLGEFKFCSECICHGICKCFLCSNLKLVESHQIMRQAKTKVAHVWEKIRKKVELSNQKRLVSNWDKIIFNYLSKRRTPHNRLAQAMQSLLNSNVKIVSHFHMNFLTKTSLTNFDEGFLKYYVQLLQMEISEVSIKISMVDKIKSNDIVSCISNINEGGSTKHFLLIQRESTSVEYQAVEFDFSKQKYIDIISCGSPKLKNKTVYEGMVAKCPHKDVVTGKTLRLSSIPHGDNGIIGLLLFLQNRCGGFDTKIDSLDMDLLKQYFQWTVLLNEPFYIDASQRSKN